MSTIEDALLVDQNYVVSTLCSPNVHIIDIRSEAEIMNIGMIPTSIHIPYMYLEGALYSNPITFEQKLDVKKPSVDAQLIFFSEDKIELIGALKCARNNNYTNVRVFKGGWKQWSQLHATHADIMSSISDPNTLMIDVRSSKELKIHGPIPSSMHIPCTLDSDPINVEMKMRQNVHETANVIIIDQDENLSAILSVKLLMKIGIKSARYLVGGWSAWKKSFVGHAKMISSINNEAVQIIDLRSPDVVETEGTIPCSLNIPFRFIHGALSASSKDFYERLNSVKPPYTKQIIFFSDNNAESIGAMDIAQSFNYLKATYYTEGWAGWKKHIVEIKNVDGILNDYLIDMRSAIGTDGMGFFEIIPKSVNIKFKFIKKGLTVPADNFETVVGKRKPNIDESIVLFSDKNKEAVEALEFAIECGYTNAKCFFGDLKELYEHIMKNRIKNDQNTLDSSMFG